MDRATIKAAEKNLARIFNDDYLFHIPPYQRPYAWTKDETIELFDDIWDSCKDKTDLNELAPYFLGSIVLIKSPSLPRADVVDGQQRLTTLTILFSVLRDLALQEKSQRDIDAFVKQSGSSVLGTADEYRLKTRRQDSEFFRQHIQDAVPFDVDGLPLLPDSQKNMIQNRKFLEEKAAALSSQDRDHLIKFMAQKCFLVAVEASDQSSAYRVFSVMNNRGLDLAPTDILKADIIGAIPEGTTQDKYNRIWEDLEDHLGRSSFVDLFSHIRMIHRRQKAKNTLAEEVTEWVKPIERAQSFIDTELVPYADAFRSILSKGFSGMSEAAKINGHLRHLALLDNSDWQPAAIVAISKLKTKEMVLEAFLRRLDRIAFYMFTVRTNVNDRIRRYATILDAIDRNVALEDGAHPINLTKAEQTDWLEALDEPLYPKLKIRKSILLRLDEAISDGAASYDHPVITIEHVCPQNPSDDWQGFFGDEDPEDWVHSISNLVLLTQKKNSAASNWGFERKKTEYFAKNETTSFPLTSQVASTKNWTLDTLYNRQVMLIKKLAAMWELDDDVIEDWENS